ILAASADAPLATHPFERSTVPLVPQHASSDDGSLNLARPLVDAGHANVPRVPLDGEVAHVAVAPVDLERAVADAIRRLGREDLGHGGLARERLTLELQGGGAKAEK